jgi:predicted DNA-binding transcriptional regulator AlpA
MSRGADTDRCAFPHEVVGAAGAAKLLGLAQRNSTYTLKSRYTRDDTPDELRWPEPWKQEGQCIFWHRDDIIEWQERRLARRRKRPTDDDASSDPAAS